MPACCPHCGGLLGTPEDGAGQGDVRGEYAGSDDDEDDLAGEDDGPRSQRGPSDRSRAATWWCRSWAVRLRLSAARRERCTRRVAGSVVQEADVPHLRGRVGAGLAAGAVRGAAGSRCAGRDVGGDASGRGGAALGRGALCASRAARHGARLGCRVDGMRSRSGRGISRALEAAAQRRAQRVQAGDGPMPSARGTGVGAAEARAGACSPVFHLTRRLMCGRPVLPGPPRAAGAASRLRVRRREAGKSMQIMSGERAAAYLSSYFVRGKGTKATLQENARNPHLPRMLIWVSPTLTGATGITMRNLVAAGNCGRYGWGLLPRRPGQESSWPESCCWRDRGPLGAREAGPAIAGSPHGPAGSGRLTLPRRKQRFGRNAVSGLPEQDLRELRERGHRAVLAHAGLEGERAHRL